MSPHHASRYPAGIPWIIATEGAERFSYYGMRAILTTFLVTQFFNPGADPALQAAAEAEANARTHFFVSLAYFMPLVGALLADGLFGRYRVILGFALVYCLGHACLALFDSHLEGFMAGLFLLALGAGGIKANVSAFVGTQFVDRLDRPGQEALLARAYGWFYFSINAGAVVAMALTPWLLATRGPAWAFGVPGLFMALATLLFWLGRRHYRHEPRTGLADAAARGVFLAELKGAWRVLALFAFIPFFWALWDQCQSEWVLQAAHLDLQLLPGLTVLPAQVQLANPALVLLLIPLLTTQVYPALQRRGISIAPTRRMLAGLVLTAASFAVITGIQHAIDAGGQPSVWWQLLAYLLLTTGEVLVSVTGLEFAYTQAPPRLKSLIAAFWLLTVSIGNLGVALVNDSIASGGFFAGLTGASFYAFFTALMLVVLGVFGVVAGRLFPVPSAGSAR